MGVFVSQAWLGSALPVADAAHRAAAQAAHSFSACRALVLDSSYRPIDVVGWQRAICLDLFDKVDVLGAHPACQPCARPALLAQMSASNIVNSGRTSFGAQWASAYYDLPGSHPVCYTKPQAHTR